jgi:predicted nucleic acid-binding protein
MNKESGYSFFDTNVLLEALVQGRSQQSRARQYLDTHQTVVSPLSAHLIVHFGQRDGLTLDFLMTLLLKYKFTDFGSREITWAVRNCQGDDFEDALQVACAVCSGSQFFVTLDKKLAKRYQHVIPMQIL